VFISNSACVSCICPLFPMFNLNELDSNKLEIQGFGRFCLVQQVTLGITLPFTLLLALPVTLGKLDFPITD